MKDQQKNIIDEECLHAHENYSKQPSVVKAGLDLIEQRQ